MNDKYASYETPEQQAEREYYQQLNANRNSGSSRFLNFIFKLAIGLMLVGSLVEWVHSQSLQIFYSFGFTAPHALYYAYAGDVLFFILLLASIGLCLFLFNLALDFFRKESTKKFVGTLLIATFIAAANYYFLSKAFPKLDGNWHICISVAIVIPFFIRPKLFFITIIFPSLVLLDDWLNLGIL